MLQVDPTGKVISPAEVYETAEARQMQHFEILAGSAMFHQGGLVQRTIPVRVVLAERMSHYADHITRGRRIFVQGTVITFQQIDADGVDREQIMVLAHFVELLDRPLTRQGAQTAIEEVAAVYPLPRLGIEDDLPF
jgi:hypothetical protein